MILVYDSFRLYGKFADGAGGMVIYQADSLKEVLSFVENAPYIVQKARDYEVHEWDMVQ
jgi:uncharacterized protein YciI